MNLATDTTSQVAQQLLQYKHTVSIAESSSGGIISARLLSIPGASGYYRGGSVIYTLPSRRAFLDIPAGSVAGMEPLTEEMVQVFADAARDKLDATWGVAELGAAGPAGSRYGHAAGTSVIGISGPVKMTTMIQTGSDDREQNMWAFAAAALELLLKALRAANPA